MRANKITNNGEVLLDLTQDTATPETVGEGVTFHTADGSPAVGTAKLGGGGVAFNIAYGDEPPEDTTKLWVKTTEPSGVVVSQYSDGNLVQFNAAEIMQAKLPQAVSFLGCCKIGRCIYTFGGQASTTYTTTICKIDLDTQEVTTLTEVLPTAVNSALAVAVGEKAYIFGGSILSGNSNTVYCFDSTTETVTTLSATLTYSGAQNGGCLIDGKIYLFASAATNYRKYVIVFDTNTETFSTLSTRLEIGTQYMPSAAIGAKIYIFTQTNGQIQCFDTETNTVEILPCTSSNTPYGPFAAGVIGEKVYLFGGNPETSNVTELDTAKLQTSVSNTTIPITIARATCVSADGCIYLLGIGVTPTTTTDEIVRFSSADFLLETGKLHILPSVDGNVFPLINAEDAKVEIGVSGIYKGNTEGIGEEVEAALYKDGAWQTI